MPSLFRSISIAINFLVTHSSEVYADEMFLHLRWPGGKCSTGTYCCYPKTFPLQDEFTIEYMAKKYSSGGSHCSGTRFYVNALQPIMRELNIYWPSFDCADDANVKEWEQIWQDNGDCSGLSQREYFTAALNLRKQANLLDLLSKKGIRPSRYSTYRQEEVVDAINEGLGVKAAVLHCGASSMGDVKNIRLCVDNKGTKFIECSDQKESVCDKRVKFNLIPQFISEKQDNPIEMVALA